MENSIDSAIEALEKAKALMEKASKDSKTSKAIYKLSEIRDYVDSFCERTKTKKSDICLFADISPTTFNNALKKPEKATMNTLLAIGEVVGFELLIGRNNG